MNDIYVLNQNFEIIGVIDEYVSSIWRPAYYDIGDFELYLGATEMHVELLQANRYLVRSQDITVDDENKTTFKKVMVIKNIDLITDVENGDFLTITGRELKYILHQRIIWTQTNIRGAAEDGIRQLVTDNAISPADANRVIPTLTLAAANGYIDTIDKQITGSYLDESIVEICSTFNYGWDIYINDNMLIFDIYEGLDRSYDQSALPYVVFSDSFENLYNTEYQMFSESYANTALIGGEGEGTERVYATLGTNNAGLDRYETFIDARDISSNSGTEDEISTDDYNLLLIERGYENMAALGITEGFTGEVLSDVAFKYGEDFNLGDIVTVINKYGLSKTVRVLSAIESEDSDGAKLLPQFNI